VKTANWAAKGGPRFAAGDIGAEGRIRLQDPRTAQPAQHRHHQQVGGAERAVQPVGVAEPAGKLVQPRPDASVEHELALLEPRLVALHERGDRALEDRRLHRAERGEHPGDGARPAVGVIRQQAGMALGDVENDRPRLEQHQIAVLIGRDLPERMDRPMGGLFHRGERE
jgi:hypothetical protein